MSVHIVRIRHDAESHDYDCHDDCEAEVICPGVTDACRTWWECDACLDALSGMNAADRDEYHERLYETSEAHGVVHEHIDGMWMTATDQCLASEMEHNAGELVDTLPDGDHPVDLSCEDGFVYVVPIPAGASDRGTIDALALALSFAPVAPLALAHWLGWWSAGALCGLLAVTALVACCCVQGGRSEGWER